MIPRVLYCYVDGDYEDFLQQQLDCLLLDEFTFWTHVEVLCTL